MPQYKIQIQLNTGRSVIKFNNNVTIVMNGAKEFRFSKENLNFNPNIHTVLVIGTITHFIIGNKQIDISAPGARPASVTFFVQIPAGIRTLKGTVVQLSEPAGPYTIEVVGGGSQSFSGVVINQAFSINLS